MNGGIPIIGGAQPRQVQVKRPYLKLLTEPEKLTLRPLAYVVDLDPNVAKLLVQMVDAAIKAQPEVADAVLAPEIDLMSAEHRARFNIAIVLTDPMSPEDRKAKEEAARRFMA